MNLWLHGLVPFEQCFSILLFCSSLLGAELPTEFILSTTTKPRDWTSFFSFLFQLFKASHIFEKYDLVYKRYFGFEKDEQQDLSYKMPLRFIWGIQPLDEGSYLDPGSRGKMVLDPEFDISSTDSQRWMLRFCQQVRKQPFYKPTQGPLLSNCFMETFKQWMERRCKDELTGEDR